jgi:hypothetical protein
LSYFFLQLHNLFIVGPTEGFFRIIIQGDNFGSYFEEIKILVGGIKWEIDFKSFNQTYLVILVSPGEGSNLPIKIIVGNQYSNRKFFTFDPPEIFSYSNFYAISTEGSKATNSFIMVTGKNFGIFPIVVLGKDELQIYNNTHNSLIISIPPGQGKDIVLFINVSNQLAYFPVLFSYARPLLLFFFPSTCSTKGGRAESLKIEIHGQNFGNPSKCDELKILFGDTFIDQSDIFYNSSTLISFYPPPGEGINIFVVVFVSGVSSNEDNVKNYFSYKLPKVESVVQDHPSLTSGEFNLYIFGNSFSWTGLMIYITDPILYKNKNNSINHEMFRMNHVDCPILKLTENMIVCNVPGGFGKNLSLSISHSIYKFNITIPIAYSYDTPEIVSVFQASGGDAMGGEIVRVFGNNFGTYYSPVTFFQNSVSNRETLCLHANWIVDQNELNIKFVECYSLRATVGWKNISLLIAYQFSPVYQRKYRVECKKGFFGMEG